jgi:hypothetical protein
MTEVSSYKLQSLEAADGLNQKIPGIYPISPGRVRNPVRANALQIKR